MDQVVKAERVSARAIKGFIEDALVKGEAVRLSPENVPLRRHLAESLLAQGRPDLAEAEFRDALALAPEDAHLKVGLANAFVQQGKNDLAIVQRASGPTGRPRPTS